MASRTRWMWVWVNSGSWWWIGRPSVLWFRGTQRVRHDWVTELNWIPWLLQLHWPSKLPLYSPMTMVTTPCPQNSALKPALFRPQRLLFSSHAFLFPWLIFPLCKFTISLIFLFSPYLLACFWHLLLFLKCLLIRTLNFSASCHSIPSTS